MRPRRFALILAVARASLWRGRRALAAAGLSALVLGSTWVIGTSVTSVDTRLGRLHFPISCGWQSQRDFTTATSLLHLFQFGAAEEAYRSLVKQEPDCAMAYWGIAMSRLGNPLYGLPSARDTEVANEALAAGANARMASGRERAYLAAAAALFEPDRSDWGERKTRYAQAMGRLVADYPQDREAAIFYALALNFSTPPAERTSRAAELLLLVFSEEPEHPGIDHYLAYCLGHAGYQPKPFERAPTMTKAQRILLATFSLVALCGLGLFVAFMADFRPGAAQADNIGGPFVLSASDGTMVTDRTYRGRWTIVYFGYTHCPDVCPTTLLTIAQVLERLGPLAAKVQPLFVTLDPERDTPAAMEEYAKAFDPRIVGLTGKAAEIAAVAKQYRVFFRKLPGQAPDDYAIEHSSYLYVMGPDGRYVTLFSHDQLQAPDVIASRLRELLSASAQHDDEGAPHAGGIGLATDRTGL